jgi:hypothetical protein
MATERARNSWGIYLHHEAESILELRWLASTADMGDAGMRASLSLFALEAERVRPRFLLVDGLEFRHRPVEGFVEWRNDCVIPRYGSAGVQKFAFIVPESFPRTIESGGKEQIDGPAIFPTAWFSKRQNALDWFKR